MNRVVSGARFGSFLNFTGGTPPDVDPSERAGRVEGVPVRILVLGGDGYLGWPTAIHLSAVGHHVGIADNFIRRQFDHELGVESLVPIETLSTRVRAWRETTGRDVDVFVGDLTDPDFTHRALDTFRPDAVIHFAEQRSAPYSMIDRRHAVYTQSNNVVGTLNLLYAIAETNPDIHLVKLGTMGEYGTPNIDIEEGWLEITHHGRSDRVLYPKRPGSFYHLSKVHDSHNIEFACRVWGLRATDLNQGVVYGEQTDETALDDRLATRFDYDAVFGTVLNRFVILASLGEPLTVYGDGGQTRGIIDIRDTVECIRIAAESPPAPGEFRVFNQMTEAMSVLDIAKVVAAHREPTVEIEYLENPRVEAESHYYRVIHTGLIELGLRPHLLSETLLTSLYAVADRFKHRADLSALRPTVRWRAPLSAVS
jgi:UDP-sulfoquinovose synthase